MENFELYHHGIKGMRWGIRRTKAQLGYKTNPTKRKAKSINDDANERIKQIKARGREESKIAKAEERAAARIAKAEAKYLPKKKESEVNKPKSLSEMSDDEIRTKINRVRLENELKQLTPQEISKGQKFVNSLAKDVVGPAARDAGKRLLTDFLNKKGAELLGLNKKDVEDAATKLKKEVDYLQDLKKKDVLNDYFEKKKSKEAEAAADAADAEKRAKQAAKEAKAEEKKAAKEAKAAEKQAAKEAKAAKNQEDKNKSSASDNVEYVDDADVIVEGSPSSKSKKQKSSNRYYEDIIDIDGWEKSVDDISGSSSVSRGRSYVESMLPYYNTPALPYSAPALPYKEGR
jgi:hypothetical protein